VTRGGDAPLRGLTVLERSLLYAAIFSYGALAGLGVRDLVARSAYSAYAGAAGMAVVAPLFVFTSVFVMWPERIQIPVWLGERMPKFIGFALVCGVLGFAAIRLGAR